MSIYKYCLIILSSLFMIGLSYNIGVTSSSACMTTIKTISKAYYTLKKNKNLTELRLSSTIAGKDEYFDLLPYFLSLTDKDVVNVYLAGNGGDVDGGEFLVSLFRTTKAHINLIVFGDVYSMHATLAVSGFNLYIINPNSLFLFHVPALESGQAVSPALCNDELGVDRGQSKKQKCIDFITATMTQFSNIFGLNIQRALTLDEYSRFQQGWDVILTGQEVINNLTKHP